MPRCRHCGVYGDDWQVRETEINDDGTYTTDKGRTYSVVKHPHLRVCLENGDGTVKRVAYYRIVPCADCPEVFKEQFASRMERDEEVADMVKFM